MSTAFFYGNLTEQARTPTARLLVSQNFAVLGSVITVDLRQSSDEDNRALTYNPYFISVPIGSHVRAEGFKSLDADGTLLSFAPDIVGKYIIGLTVENDAFKSEQVVEVVDVRAIVTPHARGIVPDGKFIWSYLRDAWTQVDGREFFEVLWSALIQICGAELLKLYQVDFNKSIRDIQDLFQRRWMSYEPKFLIDQDNASFFIGNHTVGNDATTGVEMATGLAIITSARDLVVVQGTVIPDAIGRQISIIYSEDEQNVGDYQVAGLTPNGNGFRLGSSVSPTKDTIAEDVGFTFSLGSSVWTIGQMTKKLDMAMAEAVGIFPYFDSSSEVTASSIKVGDVIVFATGPNTGIYRVVDRSGSNFVVDHPPPDASDSTLATVYRPVGFALASKTQALSNSIGVPLSSVSALMDLAPGRIVVVAGQALTLTRVSKDLGQRVPLAVLVMDQAKLRSGLKALYWRVPHTLVSKTQDFEALGVVAGDVFIAALATDGGIAAEVKLQVVGVDRNRLGFVFSDEAVEDGKIAPLPDGFVDSAAAAIGISDAKDFLSEAVSVYFKRKYWNTELTATTPIEVAGRTFFLRPRAIIRNSFVPVDETLRSIPALQEYVKYPQLREERGKVYQIANGQEYELARKPAVLSENTHYLVDGVSALSGELTVNTGSTIIEADGDFYDRNVRPGDELVIEDPLSAYGSYQILDVLGPTKIRISKPIPAIGNQPFLRVRASVKRSRSGHFIRFVPGLFGPKNPAPSRLWAEVSFFDNNESIERNFGVLVNLTRDDLEKVESQASYRQAVAGLMYAYVKGPKLDKVKLGASLLLGLPFSEHAGIVRAVENDYRRSQDGTPILGRVLIEDTDSAGEPTGMMRVYTFPVDETSDLAGVDVNPKTGKTFQVGDQVDAFICLAKGVEVLDNKDPWFGTRSAEALLQQFHTMRVRVNDSLFGPKEIDLVSDFLRRITPRYVSLVITSTTEVQDSPALVDKVTLTSKSGQAIVDFIGGDLATPFIFDAHTIRNVSQARWDEGAFLVRRAGKDLQTTTVNEVKSITVPSGGLLAPRDGEVFESPLCASGDKLAIISGKNRGTWDIASLTDQEIVLLNGPTYGLEDGTSQHFAILRSLRAKLAAGSGARSQASEQVVVLSPGLRTAGVSPGDALLLDTAGTTTRHVILAVQEEVEGTGVWNAALVSPAPSTTKTEVEYEVWRPSLFASPSGEVFSITCDGTNTFTCADNRIFLLTDVRDELLFFEREDQMRTMLVDPRRGYMTPPVPAGTYNVKIVRRGKMSQTGVTFDFENVRDVVETKIFNSDPVSCSDDQAQFASLNPATLKIKPGDFLWVGPGNPGSIDIGYGTGIYPVVQVSSTTVKVAQNWPSTFSPTQWALVRRR